MVVSRAVRQEWFRLDHNYIRLGSALARWRRTAAQWQTSMRVASQSEHWGRQGIGGCCLGQQGLGVRGLACFNDSTGPTQRKQTHQTETEGTDAMGEAG